MLYVFDMGNVVIKGIDVNENVAKLLGVDIGEFNSDYAHYVFPLMEGNIKIQDYYRHVEYVFGVKVPGNPISELFDPYFNIPMLEVIDELRNRGNRIVCASNTFAPHWDVIRERGLDKVFDKCYLSHEMHLSKPSAAYFNALMKEEGVKPEEVFFTDDYKENVDGAAKLGIKTLWYSNEYDDGKLKKAFGL